MDKRLNELASALIERLKKESFILQRLDAVSTNSIYIKLDYGVANSIRISDHAGKQHLSYRYNVLKNLEKPYSITEYKNGRNLDRHFYGVNDIDKLLNDICEEQLNRINRYGEQNYALYMAENKNKEGVVKGFWSKAKVV